MKIITIIGARPQIIKAAAISRAIQKDYSDRLTEVIVHTGQHYDENMSAVFFDELGIPQPNYNLSVGSGTHGKQTAAMLEGIEEIILKEQPDALLVYGDTNSTVAGGLAASKLHVPLIHIEAGLRSYNKKMPEEINRILCDHMSTLLFSPTKTGIENLSQEGFSFDETQEASADNPKVYHCGDIMYDNSLYFSRVSDEKSSILSQHDLKKGAFILSTIHRDGNTDYPEKLQGIFESLMTIAENKKIVLPLHPRTKNKIQDLPSDFVAKIEANKNILIIDPVPFLDVIALEKNASMIITDSGGLQKEAYFFEKPCLILRPETEWKEIVENGNAIITDSEPKRILEGYKNLNIKENFTFPNFYGDGKAASFICSRIIADL